MRNRLANQFLVDLTPKIIFLYFVLDMSVPFGLCACLSLFRTLVGPVVHKNIHSHVDIISKCREKKIIMRQTFAELFRRVYQKLSSTARSNTMRTLREIHADSIDDEEITCTQ